MRFSRHPETALAPLMRGELEPAERDRVSAHLERCARCRATAGGLAATLTALRVELAARPAPDWRDYRAQLRHRIVRERPHNDDQRSWLPWRALAPLGAAAGLAAALALVVILLNSAGDRSAAPTPDQLAAVNDLGVVDLGLMRDYPVVAHLDMLEDYDVIEHLDVLPATAPDADETSPS